MKDREYLRFIKSTAGLFVWPIAIVNEIKMDIAKMKRGTNRCSIVFVVATIILFFWVYSNLAVFILIGPSILPISFILYTSYYYFQLAIKDMHLLNKEWIQDISVSESVQFEEVMNEILNRLHSEFPFPRRFHLARNYPLLVYTGRTKTTFALIRLKEAILYPELTEEKEESTGA